MIRRTSQILVGLLVVGATAGTSMASAHVDRIPAAQTSTGEIGRVHTSVINGQEAAPGTFPYLASIHFNNGSEAFACSGTVVSSNVVLTAAHCAYNEAGNVLHNPVYYAVSTGNVNRESPQRVVSSAIRIAVFPGYSKTGHYGDAAILQLAAPISAPPVRLGGSEYWGTGTGAYMVGWGLTVGIPEEAGPAVLHYGTTTIQSPGFCQSKSSGFLATQQLCVIDAPSHVYSACFGDSGGPLLIGAPGTGEPIEIGIDSFGLSEECETTLPQFYTRADLVSAWVSSKIAEYAPPPPAPAPAPVPAPTPAPKVAPVVVPKLPRLTAGAARSYMTQALLTELGGRFKGRRAYTGRCREVNETKQSCGTTWTVGGTDFYGNVTIYYAFEAGKVIWNDRYTIHWVNDYCYFDSDHRNRCRVGTARR